ncbi:MAG: PKD domain-containing protein [Candidatus Diapherotrites archaeon]|nr:PKD domain-containing protein [Candidatus Diapherotrites archaeon]
MLLILLLVFSGCVRKPGSSEDENLTGPFDNLDVPQFPNDVPHVSTTGSQTIVETPNGTEIPVTDVPIILDTNEQDTNSIPDMNIIVDLNQIVLSVDLNYSPDSTNYLKIFFTGTANGGTPHYNFNWDFGDGNTTIQSTAEVSAKTNFLTTGFATFVLGFFKNIFANFEENTEQPIVEPIEQKIEHTFPGDGSYEVKLVVVDSQNLEGTKSLTLNLSSETEVETDSTDNTSTSTSTVPGVYNLSDRGFLGTVTILPATGNAPHTLTYKAELSGGKKPYTIKWDFGNGTTSSLEAGSVVYEKAGNYTVSFTADDSSGKKLTKTAAIIVSFTVDVTAVPSVGKAPLESQLDVIATGGNEPYTYAWTASSGILSASTMEDAKSVKNPKLVLNSPGPYSATAAVVVTDVKNFTAKGNVLINVQEAGAVKIIADPKYRVGKGNFKLTAETVPGASSYVWSLSGFTIPNGKETTVSDVAPGIYEVSLIVKDSGGGILGTGKIPLGVADELKFSSPSNYSIKNKRYIIDDVAGTMRILYNDTQDIKFLEAKGNGNSNLYFDRRDFAKVIFYPGHGEGTHFAPNTAFKFQASLYYSLNAIPDNVPVPATDAGYSSGSVSGGSAFVLSFGDDEYLYKILKDGSNVEFSSGGVAPTHAYAQKGNYDATILWKTKYGAVVYEKLPIVIEDSPSTLPINFSISAHKTNNGVLTQVTPGTEIGPNTDIYAFKVEPTGGTPQYNVSWTIKPKENYSISYVAYNTQDPPFKFVSANAKTLSYSAGHDVVLVKFNLGHANIPWIVKAKVCNVKFENCVEKEIEVKISPCNIHPSIFSNYIFSGETLLNQNKLRTANELPSAKFLTSEKILDSTGISGTAYYKVCKEYPYTYPENCGQDGQFSFTGPEHTFTSDIPKTSIAYIPATFNGTKTALNSDIQSITGDSDLYESFSYDCTNSGGSNYSCSCKKTDGKCSYDLVKPNPITSETWDFFKFSCNNGSVIDTIDPWTYTDSMYDEISSGYNITPAFKNYLNAKISIVSSITNGFNVQNYRKNLLYKCTSSYDATLGKDVETCTLK